MRLNAFLARAGISSRRGADQLVKAGRVKVNGRLGQLNDDVSEKDHVLVNAKQIKLPQKRYILLYKPAGYLTTLKDPARRPTTSHLVDIPERVVPVGRLDYDTTGVLLLTNDGQLAQRLMHPSFEVDKVYEAEVGGTINDEKLQKLATGIRLDDGKTAPAQAKKLAANIVQITVHEGRKHQIKRMLKAVDLPVKNLHRAKYGPLQLDGLKPGQWRDLTPTELNSLS
jgi:23S rRNA pseudouridine2605 synthase